MLFIVYLTFARTTYCGIIMSGMHGNGRGGEGSSTEGGCGDGGDGGQNRLMGVEMGSPPPPPQVSTSE